MAPRSVAQRSALPLAVPEARGGQRRREDESRSPRSSTAHYLGLQLWARQHARLYEIFERTLTVATRRRTPKGARVRSVHPYAESAPGDTSSLKPVNRCDFPHVTTLPLPHQAQRAVAGSGERVYSFHRTVSVIGI